MSLAATFFLVYEVVKSLLAAYEGSTLKTPFVHMFAASTGEIVGVTYIGYSFICCYMHRHYIIFQRQCL